MARVFFCILVLLAIAFPAMAQQSRVKAQDKLQDFNSTLSIEEQADIYAVNNTVFVLYHEIGHLLIGELGIPVLAKEEDAADNLAALLLLSAETVEADQALIDSADGWFLSDRSDTSEFYDDSAFYGEHSLDVQRAFQIVCLMVGADVEIFGEIAGEVGIDADRQETCAADFDQASNSWNRVLAPHINDDAELPEISVTYDPASDYLGAKELLVASAVLEDAGKAVLSQYNLPRPVTLRGTECGEANAFFDPETHEVVMCYEMVDFFYGLFISFHGSPAEEE